MDFLDSSSHHYSYHTLVFHSPRNGKDPQVDPQNMVHNTIELGEPVVVVVVVVPVGYNDHHNHNGMVVVVPVVVSPVGYNDHHNHNGMDPHHNIAHNTPHTHIMRKTA